MTAGGSAYDLKEVVAHFEIAGEFVRGFPIGQGHINDTFMVEVRRRERIDRYTFQRINHHVFRNPERMMENFEKVTRHMREKLLKMPGKDPARETLNLIFSKSGKNYHLSADGNYWRAYRYVDGSRTVEIARSPEQAYYAGRAFGCFQKLLADFPASGLFETIPFFHHTPRRFDRFLAVLGQDACGRAEECRESIGFALERRAMISVVADGLEDGSIPLRITHNDTKINNILFDDETGKAICVIDLDTTMPGAALYDFGDMVRTTTSFCAEDERDLSTVQMEIEMFRALARGYLEEVGELLTTRELDLLVFSCRLMTYTIGLRFLTDHLEGDVYFKIHRPGHNLDRARVQFALVKSMKEQEGEMKKIIASLR